MYQNVLSKQWNDLVEDFVTENRNSPSQAIGQLRDWYRVRTHRFSSITAIEGMTLDQVNNPEFAQALRAKMKCFDFKKPEAQATPDARIGVVVGAVVGVALVFLLPLLPFLWTKWWIVRILVGIVAFIAIALGQINSVSNAQKKEQDRVFMEYARQLQEYLSKLLDVCKQYGVN